MSAVRTYDPPGLMTDSMIPGKIESCQADAADSALHWLCTRQAGHEGDHEAGLDTQRKAASWPQESQS